MSELILPKTRAHILEAVEPFHRFDGMFEKGAIAHWNKLAQAIHAGGGSRRVVRNPGTFDGEGYTWGDSGDRLDYSVITGDVVTSHMTSLFDQYHNAGVLPRFAMHSIRRVLREPYDELSRLHVAMLGNGSRVPWHRDKHEIKCALFLTTSRPGEGAHLEIRPNRGGDVHKIEARAGRLVVFDSNRCEYRLTTCTPKTPGRKAVVFMDYIHPFVFKIKRPELLNDFMFGKMDLSGAKE